MKIIVGLGNPSEKFEKTRHNVGFAVVESLKLKVKSFSDWKNNKKLLSEISEGEISGEKVILAKPQTFMNSSGKTAKSLINFYKITSPGLVAIHDDIDLPLGKIRISRGRGSAGHKGVESIIRELKTKDFIRFRIGINQFAQNQKVPSEEQTPKIKNQKLDKFVLKKFTKDEEKVLKEAIKKTVEAIETTIKEGQEKAMTKFNQ